MDFLKPSSRAKKKGLVEIYPKFIVCDSKDLMIRGGKFYAIWDEEDGLWKTRQSDAIRLIDEALDKKREEYIQGEHDRYGHVDDNQENADTVVTLHLRDSDNGMIDKWIKYTEKQMEDNYHDLDPHLTFKSEKTKKDKYPSKRLDYDVAEGDYSAWDKLVGTLYSPEERQKIEWAIGSIVNGDSVKIQKFFVFYGKAGTGKSTIMDIIDAMFKGYTTKFDAKALGSGRESFALEPFKNNPLVAIQQDGDLSKIEDNTRLNSIVSHEEMTINEKFKSLYVGSFHAMLFMGTNSPVRITDTKSGLMRRLIDIYPSGQTIPNDEYNDLMDQIKFEYGAIAYHCKQVYEKNKKLYNKYKPENMMSETNIVYNFMEEYSLVYSEQGKNWISLNEIWNDYHQYCENSNVFRPMQKIELKIELKTYFREFADRAWTSDGKQHRNCYRGFKDDIFDEKEVAEDNKAEDNWLDFKEQHSLLDDVLADCPAQYEVDDDETGNPRPQYKWANVKTKLKDLDTSKIHYVKVPQSLISMDFDIKGDDGKKSFEKNVEAAKQFPKTYGELSKSGVGIHLEYWYEGDPTKLSALYSENVEIKVFPDDKNGALRRKLTKCNNVPIAKLNSGLPLKGEGRKKVVNRDAIVSEKTLRRNITKIIKKEMDGVPSTASGVALIKKMLDEAYDSGSQYDVSDMHDAVLYFGMNSSHQADNCMKMISQMKFHSETIAPVSDEQYHEDDLNFFDIEVFPNYMCICSIPVSRDEVIKYTKMEWKDFLVELESLRPRVVKEINPDADVVRAMSKKKDVGFNCRRYDNHICYARQEGYSLKQCYDLSQKIINDHNRNNFFGNAYDWSYTDVYDFCAKKQSLKKWEIELGINHLENEYPWDQPLEESHWDEVANYCVNDVLATLAVFVKRYGDFVAREILSALSGLNVNATTNQHTTAIIFGKDKHPGLVYTDLSTGKSYGPGENFQMPVVTQEYYEQHKDDWKKLSMNPPKNCFPGYFYVRFDDGTYHNMYRGVDLGFGGYVYASPGMYLDGAVTEDVASEHPHSIKELNLFGEHTQKFVDLMEARICIKHKDYEGAKKLFGGKLAPYLDDPAQAKALSQALKIAINSVYGLTSAKFDNAFRDSRNVNNIVALRGALFMKTVQDAVEERGFHVIHIKTDSIKIEHPNDYILNYVIDLGHQYGYDFEVEHTWDRLCLVNNAVFIGRHGKDDPDSPGVWDAVGTQFQIPYVFKTLFSHEEIKFEDMCETKSVTSALYLDCREGLPDVSKWEDLKEIRRKIANGSKVTNRAKSFADENSNLSDEELDNYISKGHNRIFVGKVGSFCPMQEGCGAGELLRKSQDRNGNDKFDSATGAKWIEDGHEVNRWLEANVVRSTHKEKFIDRTYYRNLVDDAVASINEFGSFEDFIA